MRQVLDGSEPILLVSRDDDDKGWQFIGSTDACAEDGRVACLEFMAAPHPSVSQLADMPPNWKTIRLSRTMLGGVAGVRALSKDTEHYWRANPWNRSIKTPAWPIRVGSVRP